MKFDRSSMLINYDEIFQNLPEDKRVKATNIQSYTLQEINSNFDSFFSVIYKVAALSIQMSKIR